MLNIKSYAFNSSMLSVALRGLTLASKFLLMIYLARVLSPEQVGIYGLFTVTVSFALFLVGLDFYAYATREMLSRPKTEWAVLIRDQLVFYSVVYLLALPALSVVFFVDILDKSLIVWFYFLLVMEHLSQESYRLLVAMQRQVYANVVLFLRSGAWVYVVVTVMCLSPHFQSLDYIWPGWAVGVASSLLLTVFVLREFSWFEVKKTPVNWSWLWRGANVAIIFILSSLMIRGIFTFDRYFIKSYWGNDMVGVYTVYISIVNGIQAFVDAGVLSQYYPKIVDAFYNKSKKSLVVQLMKMKVSMVRVLGILVFLTIVGIFPVLSIIDKEIYWEHIGIFWVLLTFVVIWSFGYLPHYVLYVMGKDKLLVFTSGVGFVVAMIGYILFIPRYSGIGASVTILVSVAIMVLIKYMAAKRLFYAETSVKAPF